MKNPYIKYGGACETEAMKLKRALSTAPAVEWPILDTSSIISKFRALKEQELGMPTQIQQPQLSILGVSNLSKHLKHIHIHNSRMQYHGNKLDKSSRIISCKKPFQKDPTIIDYDQDSDEEWEEIHGDNLEDDDMLIDEENMEVEQDEVEKL